MIHCNVIYYNFISDGNLSLNAITLDLRGGISIPNCYIVLCKVYNVLRKSSYESAKVPCHLQTIVPSPNIIWVIKLWEMEWAGVI
jgi:hypothetical protein